MCSVTDLIYFDTSYQRHPLQQRNKFINTYLTLQLIEHPRQPAPNQDNTRSTRK
jgi:hypothetical protein